MIQTLIDNWRVTLVAVVWLVAVALVGGLLTEVGDWYEHLRFPALRPPNWLFGPAWTLIFVLIGISGVNAWVHAADDDTRMRIVELFAVNTVFHVLWSPLFFKVKRPDWAMIELIPFWLSVLALVAYLGSVYPPSGLVIAPYLAWVTFAGWLNLRIVQLNRPFGRNV